MDHPRLRNLKVGSSVMSSEAAIKELFEQSIETKRRAARVLGPAIERAGALLTGAIDDGAKVLICGISARQLLHVDCQKKSMTTFP